MRLKAHLLIVFPLKARRAPFLELCPLSLTSSIWLLLDKDVVACRILSFSWEGFYFKSHIELTWKEIIIKWS